MASNLQKFIDIMKHPVKFRMFLFTKLPVALFSGLRVEDLNAKRCMISVPYKWFNKNPFRSTYFATLSMAGEMSTGALGMAYLYKLPSPVSLLVVSIEGKFLKKALGRTYFTCEDGLLFATAIDETIKTGEARTVQALTTGRNQEGIMVAEFRVTWSFKRR
ncbi:MAG: thioesterase [Chitinophagaceae bacterium]